MAPRTDIDQVTRRRIASWLVWYRQARGWTLQKLAEKLDVSTPTVTNIINGMRTPGLDVLIAMHRKLGRSADEILDDDPPPVPDDAPIVRSRRRGPTDA